MYDQFQSLFGETILGQDQTPMYSMLHGKEEEDRRRSSVTSRRSARKTFVDTNSAIKQLQEHLNRNFKTVCPHPLFFSVFFTSHLLTYTH
jgi:hypothetical protein